MRVLHIVKTTDGADFAVRQVRELIRGGVDVDVALPSAEGRCIPLWKATGARLHTADLGFPITRPWLAGEMFRRARELVDRLRPDLIHSHFVSTTLTIRGAFGPQGPAPRLFQAPGPLHLEHLLYRRGEIASAGPSDYWIASSRYTRDLYLRAGVDRSRLFLSYYSITDLFPVPAPGPALRARLGIPKGALVVGNINYFYRPKRYLGQSIGLKAHEDVIEALRMVALKRADVYGVMIGGPWGDGQDYFERMRRRAQQAAPRRILLPGPLPSSSVFTTWQEFDCAVHVPLSENCGGVIEPLLMGVPVIAGRVGGLPEVILDGVTGVTVPVRNPRALASAILEVLADPSTHRARARLGSRLVGHMFSAERTAGEIKRIYEYVLGVTADRPAEFEARAFIDSHAGDAGIDAKSA